MTRRSTGKTRVARSVWYARKGTVELRAAPLPRPQPGETLVRTLFSGISRGTERLVFNGEVGRSEWERMRCPNQEGAFPFPVKYGYCATGVVEVGPGELLGRTVFCLHPHQDYFNATVASLVPVPDGVPARRATLTANMETALNALWDSGAGPGDRIVVVGAGVVGLLVAALAARLPGADVTSVDVDESRRPLAQSLGSSVVLPCDVTAHGPNDPPHQKFAIGGKHVRLLLGSHIPHTNEPSCVKRRGGRLRENLGVVGGGQGAAGLFERAS
jgi:threonine dehydrogenase-like Zn-dependent dehydrogenase